MHPISIFFRNRISTVKVRQQTWWLRTLKSSVNTAVTNRTETITLGNKVFSLNWPISKQKEYSTLKEVKLQQLFACITEIPTSLAEPLKRGTIKLWNSGALLPISHFLKEHLMKQIAAGREELTLQQYRRE